MIRIIASEDFRPASMFFDPIDGVDFSPLRILLIMPKACLPEFAGNIERINPIKRICLAANSMISFMKNDPYHTGTTSAQSLIRFKHTSP